MNIKLQTVSNGVQFSVKVVPGSSRTTLAGVLDGMLKIKVAAPPEKGKANQCLTDHLSKLLGIRKKQVTILTGTTSTVKQLRVEGISLETIQQILDKKNV